MCLSLHATVENKPPIPLQAQRYFSLSCNVRFYGVTGHFKEELLYAFSSFPFHLPIAWRNPLCMLSHNHNHLDCKYKYFTVSPALQGRLPQQPCTVQCWIFAVVIYLKHRTNPTSCCSTGHSGSECALLFVDL